MARFAAKLIGIDVVPVALLERWLARYSDDQLSLVFTPRERSRAKQSGQAAVTLAISYAGKEAVAKALGTGFTRVMPSEIEILSSPFDVRVQLAGAALERAIERCALGWTGTYWRLGEDIVTTVMTI
ncbi:MAG TPA: 4'-phosphopantetheinyl transferase superfamily protein [Polyangiaceae bacterium]|nr:4'-phosphopantetheinyl transferase superfamily protein [Polyangiaceae bacterium]